MMFRAFGAKCGARGVKGPSTCCANSRSSSSADSATPPMPKPDCLKKCRLVIARRVLGSIDGSFLILCQRLVEVQQRVGHERPCRLLRGVDVGDLAPFDCLCRRRAVFSEPFELTLIRRADAVDFGSL